MSSVGNWISGLALAGCGLAAQPMPTAEEIEALRQRVRAISRQLQDLEPRYAGDRSATDEREATEAARQAGSPRVSLDSLGLRIRSDGNTFEHRVRLRIAHDFAWISQDDELKRAVGDEQDGTDFRFARLSLQGRLWEDFVYMGEFEFAGQDGEDTPKLRDVYLEYQGVPYAGEHDLSLRVGHFREPFSLDELNAITARQFLETPLLNVFAPSRNAGVQISDALLGEASVERLTWALGVFRETDDIPSSNDSDEDQGWQVTGRVTGLPVYADGGRRLLHLGAAYSRRNPDGARLRYGLGPESRITVYRYADPDALPEGLRLRDARAEDVDLYGLEAAAVLGPFSVQIEYVRSDVATAFGGELTFDGRYAQIAYALTGEHRPYRHDSARFDAPKPAHPFRLRAADRGWGAWELAARYGAANLSDGPVLGGEHESLTLGINRYLNSNVRLTANYSLNNVDHELHDGEFEVFQTRLQLGF